MRYGWRAAYDPSDAYDPPCLTPACPACGERIEGVVVAYEPDDPNYGADADGRRGIWVAGETYVSDASDTCPACGVRLTYDCDRAGNVTAYSTEDA